MPLLSRYLIIDGPYGAGPVATLWKLRLPAALPNLVTGLRIAAGLAVVFSFLHEMCLLWHRIAYGACRSYALFFLNLLFLAALFVLAIVFAAYSSNNAHNFTSLNQAFMEYGLFWCVSYLIAFSLMDIPHLNR